MLNAMVVKELESIDRCEVKVKLKVKNESESERKSVKRGSVTSELGSV
jgi:hypothetical protein